MLYIALFGEIKLQSDSSGVLLSLPLTGWQHCPHSAGMQTILTACHEIFKIPALLPLPP